MKEDICCHLVVQEDNFVLPWSNGKHCSLPTIHGNIAASPLSSLLFVYGNVAELGVAHCGRTSVRKLHQSTSLPGVGSGSLIALLLLVSMHNYQA